MEPPRHPNCYLFWTLGCLQVAGVKHNCENCIIRGLTKLRRNDLPNLLQKMKWNTANTPLTYMSGITLFLFSYQSHGLFSISRTLYDTDLHKTQQSFQGSHFCICHFNKKDAKNKKQKTKQNNNNNNNNNKKKKKPGRWVSWVLFF